MPKDTQHRRSSPQPPTTLLGLMSVAAIGVPTAGAAGALLYLVFAREYQAGGGQMLLESLAILLAGAVGGSLLWAGAWLIRRGHDSSALQRRILSLLEDGTARRGTRHSR